MRWIGEFLHPKITINADEDYHVRFQSVAL